MIDEVKVGFARLGEVKSHQSDIEKEFGVKLTIKEKNIVEFSGEGIDVWVCKKAIKGISRGFRWEDVRCLKEDDYELCVIEIRDFGRDTKKDITRLKGRVIGEEGRSRRTIEEQTRTVIRVYGKTVAIVGDVDGVELAKNAVVMLLEGARHATVYRFLEKEINRLKRGGFG